MIASTTASSFSAGVAPSTSTNNNDSSNNHSKALNPLDSFHEDDIFEASLDPPPGMFPLSLDSSNLTSGTKRDTVAVSGAGTDDDVQICLPITMPPQEKVPALVYLQDEVMSATLANFLPTAPTSSLDDNECPTASTSKFKTDIDLKDLHHIQEDLIRGCIMHKLSSYSEEKQIRICMAFSILNGAPVLSWTRATPFPDPATFTYLSLYDVKDIRIVSQTSLSSTSVGIIHRYNNEESIIVRLQDLHLRDSFYIYLKAAINHWNKNPIKTRYGVNIVSRNATAVMDWVSNNGNSSPRNKSKQHYSSTIDFSTLNNDKTDISGAVFYDEESSNNNNDRFNKNFNNVSPPPVPPLDLKKHFSLNDNKTNYDSSLSSSLAFDDNLNNINQSDNDEESTNHNNSNGDYETSSESDKDDNDHGNQPNVSIKNKFGNLKVDTGNTENQNLPNVQKQKPQSETAVKQPQFKSRMSNIFGSIDNNSSSPSNSNSSPLVSSSNENNQTKSLVSPTPTPTPAPTPTPSPSSVPTPQSTQEVQHDNPLLGMTDMLEHLESLPVHPTSHTIPSVRRKSMQQPPQTAQKKTLGNLYGLLSPKSKSSSLNTTSNRSPPPPPPPPSSSSSSSRLTKPKSSAPSPSRSKGQDEDNERYNLVKDRLKNVKPSSQRSSASKASFDAVQSGNHVTKQSIQTDNKEKSIVEQKGLHVHRATQGGRPLSNRQTTTGGRGRGRGGGRGVGSPGRGAPKQNKPVPKWND